MDRQEPAALVEALAAYAHEAWSGWMKWMLPKLLDEHMLPRGINYKRNEPGTTIFQWCDTAQDCLDRWKRQMETPYQLLSQKEKESDREEARKMLSIIREKCKVRDDPHSLEYPKCPRCGGTVVGAMMTSGSITGKDGELYYHPNAVSVYCISADCNYDRKLHELKGPPRL